MERSRELSTDDAFIKSLSETVLDNLRNEQFGAEELAKLVGVSRSQIHRKLNRILGKSLTQFIREIRLEEAYKLLLKEVGTAAEISFLVGFNSPTYFNTCFHEYFGFPPGEVKKNKSNGIVSIYDEDKSSSTSSPIPKSGQQKFHVSKANSRAKRRILWIGAVAIFIMAIITFILPNYLSQFSTPGSSNKSSNGAKNSIGVMPFDYQGLESDAHFANGVMADLQYNLSMIGNLTVISRTTMESYRDTKLTAKAITKELGVDYLLEGNVQKFSDQIRIHIQLIDGKSEKAIWSNAYHRELDDYFEVQSEIATNVAEVLYIKVSPEEMERIDLAPTTNQTAYSFYIRAREEHTKYWIATDNIYLENAIKYYYSSLHHDPSFANALAGLGLAYYDKLGRDNLDDLQSPYWDSIHKYSERAILENKKLGEAHLLNGVYEYGKNGKIEQALYQIELALEYDPNSFLAYQQKGFLLGRVYGRAFDAIINLTEASRRIGGEELATIYRQLGSFYGAMGFYEEARRCIELMNNIMEDPSVYLFELAFLEFKKRNYAEATALFEKFAGMDSTRFISPVYLIAAGEYTKAYQESLKYLEQTDGDPWIADLHRIGFSFWKAGEKEKGLHYLNAQIEKCKESIKKNSHFAQRKYSYYDLAATYAFLGEKEKAIQALDRFKNSHSFNVYAVNFLKRDDPFFDNIRADPRFREIVTHVEDRYLKEHELIKDWLIKENPLGN
jgi:TolB-like protein/AraC-like DNA-binding protein/tetratricopeptide (TPR) repeat protein